MKIIDSKKIETTLAHNAVPRKALIKVGDSRSKLQTVNDAYLEPGTGFEPHKHSDSEEIYYFLEGNGEMDIDGKKIPVGKGICVQIESGESHELLNTGKTNLRFITLRLLI